MSPSFSVYLVTDPDAPGGVVELTRAALERAPKGAVAVQARAKGASARELASLASALLPACRAASAPLLVNDRADVAKAIGADGVHLPEAGLTVGQARVVLGPRALVGRSCHDRPGLEAAQADGADFATLGPIGAVPGKGAAIGVEGFGAMVRGIALPVYALGGVDAQVAPALMGAGARGVAVIRAVYAASDPAAALEALLAAIP